VNDAPPYDAAAQLDRKLESRTYKHYGRPAIGRAGSSAKHWDRNNSKFGAKVLDGIMLLWFLLTVLSLFLVRVGPQGPQGGTRATCRRRHWWRSGRNPMVRCNQPADDERRTLTGQQR
jgi:hypothetical protein